MGKLNIDDYLFDLVASGDLYVENKDNAPLGPNTFEYDDETGILWFNDENWFEDYFMLMDNGLTYVYVGSVQEV